ncbi:hypothetical protein ALT761_01963 [Alteromonas sp. 76-1]|jgi:hypothetical protein|nr:hypothetical protein ALT761_01963 [Alteromonas sp. 76-1]
MWFFCSSPKPTYPKRTLPSAEEVKLQSLEYRANCVTETLKLYSKRIEALESKVGELEEQLSKGNE